MTIVGLALAAPPARAALGEQEASVASDRRALAATASGTTERGAYRVHELQKGATTIREFVSADGVVFAIAWSGLANPDLGPLLGAYADEYRAAARETPRRGRRAARVAGDRVVVDRWGHMRDLHGRAYLPALLPPGVTVDELR
jgi:hypothetical protein